MLMSAVGCAGGSTEGKGGRWRPHPTSFSGYNEEYREPTREAGGAGGRADSRCARKESVWAGERRGGALGDAVRKACGLCQIHSNCAGGGDVRECWEECGGYGNVM